MKPKTEPIKADGSPFRHINRGGYGAPWITDYNGYRYAVMFHKRLGYCYEIQRHSEGGSLVESLAESFGYPSPDDADIAAKIAIRDMQTNQNVKQNS